MANDSTKLVVLKIDDKQYGIDSSYFQEVVRESLVSPLPFVPPYIEGLVNIEGKIATQIDLGRYLAGRDSPSEGKELAFIQTGRSFCALRVQKVESFIEIDPSLIKKFDDREDLDTKTCVSGELVYQQDTILLLDPYAIGSLIQPRALPEAQGGLAGKVRAIEVETSAETRQYLVAEASGESFAFAISDITELVKTGHCTRVPGAPEPIIGLSLVRGQPILSVSLPGLLGITENNTTAHLPGGESWMILVDSQQGRLGLQVERVCGIESYSARDISGLENDQGALLGVVENDKGKLILVVNTPRLTGTETVARLRKFIPANRQERHSDVAEASTFLSVFLHDENYAIPLKAINRVIPYKDPQMLNDEENRVVGAIDVEGKVVPVIKMESGNSSPGNKWSEYIILENEKSEFALRVSRTDRVIDLPARQISRAKNTRNPFVSAVAHLDDQIYSLFNIEHLDSFVIE